MVPPPRKRDMRPLYSGALVFLAWLGSGFHPKYGVRSLHLLFVAAPSSCTEQRRREHFPCLARSTFSVCPHPHPKQAGGALCQNPFLSMPPLVQEEAEREEGREDISAVQRRRGLLPALLLLLPR